MLNLFPFPPGEVGEALFWSNANDKEVFEVGRHDLLSAFEVGEEEDSYEEECWAVGDFWREKTSEIDDRRWARVAESSLRGGVVVMMGAGVKAGASLGTVGEGEAVSATRFERDLRPSDWKNR